MGRGLVQDIQVAWDMHWDSGDWFATREKELLSSQKSIFHIG